MRVPSDNLNPQSRLDGHQTFERRAEIPESVHTTDKPGENPKGVRIFALPPLLNVTNRDLKILILRMALILATYILMPILSHTSSPVASSIYQSLSPLCDMSILSTVPICTTANSSAPMQEVPFPKLVEQQIRFVSVMDSASLNSNLALDLMHTEMAVKGLSAEIKLSDLELKSGFITLLDNIAELANEGNQQLINLQSGVGSTVDSILAINEWAIDALQAINTHAMRSFISNIIFPFQPLPLGRDEIIEKFDAIADLMESKLRFLIEIAQGTATTLSTLKDHFAVLQEMQLRGQHTQLQTDESFAKMWLLSKGDRRRLRSNTKNMRLLSEVEKYRSTAALRVGDTLMQLRELQADLVNLRMDVTTWSSREASQLEIAMMTLRNGAQRLSEARALARTTDAMSRKRICYGAQVPELGSSAK